MSTENDFSDLIEIPRREWQPRDWDKDSAVRHVLAAVRSDAGLHQPATQAFRYDAGSGIKKVGHWVGYATAAVVLTALVLTIRTDVLTTLFVKDTPVPMREITTQPGQRARFQLADGSSVLLNAGSTLRYSKDFGRTKRDVWLDGQALFTVTKGIGTPFIVHAGSIPTRVLGTSFMVRRYIEDKTVRVIVAEGKVALGGTALSVGEMGIARGSTDITVTRDVNIGSALSWTVGKLSFENVKLHDALRDIERWYGITIDVRDPDLLDKGITTTFATEPASEAIALLAAALEARGVLQGRRAVITNRNN